jgi:hypothetical protein
MEGVRYIQQLGSRAERRKMRGEGCNGLALTGYDGIAGRVHRGDRDVRRVAERRGDRIFVRENGGHRPGTG